MIRDIYLLDSEYDCKILSQTGSSEKPSIHAIRWCMGNLWNFAMITCAKFSLTCMWSHIL